MRKQKLKSKQMKSVEDKPDVPIPDKEDEVEEKKESDTPNGGLNDDDKADDNSSSTEDDGDDSSSSTEDDGDDSSSSTEDDGDDSSSDEDSNDNTDDDLSDDLDADSDSADGGDADDVSLSRSAEKKNSVTEKMISDKGKRFKRKSEDAIDSQSQPVSSKKKTKMDADLVTPPSNEELNQLKEAENLFHSSLFRLQLTELLEEIQLKQKRRKAIDERLHQLKKFLSELPAEKEHEISDQKWVEKKKHLRVPLLQKPWKVKGNFCFYPPTKIKVTGSYLLDTCLKSDVQVDIAVEMSQQCFQAKDHLNHRYLRKRALYLTCLASHLRKCQFVNEMKFTYHHGNHFKPILVLHVQANSGKPFKVNLHAVPEPGVFKLNRFSLTKNNVRQQWFLGSDTESQEEDVSQPPTPYYNTAILQDLTMTSQLEYLYKTQESSTGLRDGLCLLKVWLKQRELSQGFGGFSGFILSMYISYLLSVRKLNKLMSSYQVVRSALLHLSHSDWTTEPLTLKPDVSDPHCPTPVEFYQHFDVVFVDPTGYVNLCADWTRDMFFRLKHEAELSLKALDDHCVDGFEAMFMRPVPFLQKFDHIFHITHLESLKDTVQSMGLADKHLGRGGNSVGTCLSALLELLYKALGQRVHLIQVRGQAAPQWSVDEDPPFFTHDTLSVGLLLNSDQSSSVLERGPAADSLQAKEFRHFWGDQSELRRFQDGGICEAVVWPGKSIAAKRLTPKNVVKHILKRHAGILKKHVSYIGGQFDMILSDRLSDTPPNSVSTGEEGHMTVLASFDELCKILRGLDGLPLTINSIQGTAAVFRFTEVFPPSPSPNTLEETQAGSHLSNSKSLTSLPKWTPVHKVVCLLEGSGKWPEDKEAIRRLKAAFYIKLGDLLTDHDLQVKVHTDKVDVCKDGFVFRLVMSYLHEISVLKMVKTPEGMVQMRETPESVELERDVVTLPKLTSTLHGIQQKHNTFSVVCRLAKRWLSSHLMSDHISEEAVELIVSHLYINPAPFSPPSSPVCGFVRFLSFLSQFDWRSNPLMVNLNHEFTRREFTEIPSRFTKERSLFPAMCIVTPHDKTTSPWTRDTPQPPVVHRVTLLARESLKLLLTHLSQVTQVDYKQVFRPPLEMYDLIIHLRQKHLPRMHQAVDAAPVHRHGDRSGTGSDTEFPITEFDPACYYIQELKETYGDIALFFHDKYGGNLIAVLWKPTIFQAHPFKVTQLNGRMVDLGSASGKDAKTLPNMEAVIEDFRLLGGGLVDRIEIRAEKWKD